MISTDIVEVSNGFQTTKLVHLRLNLKL